MRKAARLIPIVAGLVSLSIRALPASEHDIPRYQAFDLGPVDDLRVAAAMVPAVNIADFDPQDVTANGDVIGWSFRVTSRGLLQRAARVRDGRVEPFAVPQEAGSSAALAANDSSDVVGWVEFFDPETGRAREQAAVWWEGEGIARTLGTLREARMRSIALDINNHRQVVGMAQAESGRKLAFVWHDGVMSPLPPLPGDTDTEARTINDHGEIVGVSYQGRCGDCQPHAVVWHAPAAAR